MAALLSGVFAVIVTPREEEPQIVVPMIDVMVAYPGASAKEVESRVTGPDGEAAVGDKRRRICLFDQQSPASNLTIVRFYVGENMEDSIVKLYNKLMSHYDIIPPAFRSRW